MSQIEMAFYARFLQDYPSIAHLVQKLSENNIQTIFAVTEEFQAVYKVKINNTFLISVLFSPQALRLTQIFSKIIKIT